MKQEVYAIKYSLQDADTKEVLDDNLNEEPLEFITGTKQIIQGLEDKILTMEVSQKAEVQIAPEDGYGEYDEEAVQVLPAEQFAEVELEENMPLFGTDDSGETVQVTVVSFNDEEVTIDYNHPLAGKDLMFEVEVISKRDATEEEIQTGTVGGLAAAGGCGCGEGGCGNH